MPGIVFSRARVLRISRTTSKLVLGRDRPSCRFDPSRVRVSSQEPLWGPGTCLQVPVESRFLLEGEHRAHVLEASTEGGERESAPLGATPGICTLGAEQKAA